MTKNEIVERLNELFKTDEVTIDNLENYKYDISVNGKNYSVYLAGTDEMWDLDEFFQIGIDEEGNEYKFFFTTKDEEGNDIELCDVDYSEAYKVRPTYRVGSNC